MRNFIIDGFAIAGRDIFDAAFKAAELRKELNTGELIDPWEEEDRFWAELEAEEAE